MLAFFTSPLLQGIIFNTCHMSYYFFSCFMLVNHSVALKKNHSVSEGHLKQFMQVLYIFLETFMLVLYYLRVLRLFHKIL